MTKPVLIISPGCISEIRGKELYIRISGSKIVIL